MRHEDAEDATQLLQRSRVLEINTGDPVDSRAPVHACPLVGLMISDVCTETWEVDAVLAARDPVGTPPRACFPPHRPFTNAQVPHDFRLRVTFAAAFA